MQLGIAEGRGGRRGAGNAFANTGVAAAAGVLAAFSYAPAPALIGFVAALAAGGSDTMASEVGKAWGRRPVLFPTFRRVPRRHARRDLCSSEPRPGSSVRPVLGSLGAATGARALGCAAPGHGRRDDWSVRGERHGSDPRRAWSRQQRSAQFPEHRHRRGGGDLHREVDRVMRPRFRLLFELARPFTLIAPAIGFASAAVTAAGAAPPSAWTWALLLYPAIGVGDGGTAQRRIERAQPDLRPRDRSGQQTGTAADRPGGCRCGTRGSLRSRHTVRHSCSPGSWRRTGRHECFWIVLAAAGFTIAYSVPPLRTKQRGLIANITIAIPRGVLLKVAGWSSVKTAAGLEPWFIGAIFGLFLLGASTTKDFADIEGDARGGCRTLPVRFGVRSGSLDDLAILRRPVRSDSAGSRGAGS